jgi:hypothetical protein
MSGRCPIGSAVSPTAQWKQCGRTRWAELVNDVDYLSSDLCLRSDPALVSVYLPVWLGIPTGERDETDPTCGALIRVGSMPEMTRLNAWLRQEKSRLGRRIERGLSDRREAQRSLLAQLDPEYLSASARHRRDDPE